MAHINSKEMSANLLSMFHSGMKDMCDVKHTQAPPCAGEAERFAEAIENTIAGPPGYATFTRGSSSCIFGSASPISGGQNICFLYLLC